jgi:peptide/nickel transport system substrate-binding protein
MQPPHSSWQRNRYSRRRLIRGAIVGVAGVSGLAALACKTGQRQTGSPAAGQANGSAPRSGGTFNTYITQNLAGLDPQTSSAASQALLTSSVIGNLFRFKSGPDPATYLNWDPENDLASSIESPDGVVWTVKLRPNARFHDVAPVSGHTVEAEDIKATFTRAFNLTANQNRGIIAAIDPAQIETPSPDTVVFKLRYAYGPFHSMLSGTGSEILPREALSGGYDPTKTAIGSGPFDFQTYTPDVELVLKKFPNWVEQGQPYVETLHASVIPEASQQLAQFTAGHLDDFRPAPADLSTSRAQNPKAAVLKAATNTPYVFFGHLNHPASPYTDIRVRQALSMAVDRAALGKAIFNDEYSNNGVIAAALGKWALPPDQLGGASKYYQYNLSEAKQLVDASPAAKQLRRFFYPTKQYGADIDSMWEAINPMLSAAGFNLQLVPVDYNKDYIGGGNGMLFGNYPDDGLLISPEGIHNNAETTFAINFESPGTGISKNLPQVSDPTLDEMIAKMLSTLDDGARLNALQDLQRYVADKIYVIPTPSKYVYTLVQPWVANYMYAGANPNGAGTAAKLWLDR